MIKTGSIFIFIASFILVLFFFNSKHHVLLRISSNDVIDLEVAKTPKERAKGLMFRKHLKKDKGMLFIFPGPQAYAFWMKNTLIPLDLIWLDRDKKIVYYHDETPPCHQSQCPLYAPPTDTQAYYVIEIQSGLRRKLKLNRGQILNF